MHVKIKTDGSYNGVMGEGQGIYDIFPGIDESPVHTLNCEVCQEKEESRILLHTENGEIFYQLADFNKERWSILCELERFTKPIHTFSVFYEAELKGLEGIYQVAHGMGGDTGYLSTEKLKTMDEVLGYGIFSAKFKDGTVTFYGDNHAYFRNIYRIRRKGDKFYLSCDIEIENTEVSDKKIPAIVVLTSGTMEQQLAQAASNIGESMRARNCMEPAYHWCSWYYCYQNLDMPQLEEYLEGFRTCKYGQDFKYIQIDVGYCPALGDWLTPNERFPNGLRQAFNKIRDYGYIPGIWVGAFMVGNRSRLFIEHPDWILYDIEDKPIRPWITDNEPKPFGYQDEEYYVLDTSHPDVMAYMRKVFHTLKEWGVGMIKTDFMLWGIQDSSKVKRHTPGKTSVEYFREFLKAIREEIGDETYWLGCIAPFLPFVGFADGMRIGGDVGSSWDGQYGPQNMIQSLIGNVFNNHSFYQIDPDAVMLRDYHIRLSDREVESLALLAAMSGGCIYTSDLLYKMGEARRELFHFIKPDIRRKPEIPFLDKGRMDIVMVQRDAESENGLIILFNPTNVDIKEDYALWELGFDQNINLYEIKADRKTELMNGILRATIPAHGCWLYKATKKENAVWNRNSLWKNLYE